MTSRAAHYRNKAKHAQREFGEQKPTLPARDTDTTWISEFVSSVQGLTGHLTVHSMLVYQLGDTPEERMVKLRQLSSRGILHMTAYRENGVFVEYRWTLTQAGTL